MIVKKRVSYLDSKYYILILALVVIIAVSPFIIYNGQGEQQGLFGGADAAASTAIEETGYQPWFKSIWEPPSDEVETFIFSLQAAIGALIVGYILGYYSGRSKERKKREEEEDENNLNQIKED